MTCRQGLWASCAFQLENIIVKEKHEKSASKKVYVTNPKWFSKMRTFGEMAIVAKNYDINARSQLSDCGYTVILFVYKSLKIHIKNPT
jgi:hypothetical protein